MLPANFVATDLALSRAKLTLEPGAWLTDGTISLVFNHLQMHNGAPLPGSVLLVDSGTSSLISLGSETDAQVNVVELDVHNRELIVIPVNNSQSGAADSGSHWTLLVAWRLSSRAVSWLLCFDMPVSAML